MDIRFYKTKDSEQIVPVIENLISYEMHSGVMTFNGTYNIDNTLLPQKLVIIQENRQYPALIEIRSILHRENNLVVILTKFIEDITSEQELSAWCISS
jgi:hypothetical protein